MPCSVRRPPAEWKQETRDAERNRRREKGDPNSGTGGETGEREKTSLHRRQHAAGARATGTGEGDTISPCPGCWRRRPSYSHVNATDVGQERSTRRRRHSIACTLPGTPSRGSCFDLTAPSRVSCFDPKTPFSRLLFRPKDALLASPVSTQGRPFSRLLFRPKDALLASPVSTRRRPFSRLLFRPRDALLASPVSTQGRPSRVSCFDPGAPFSRLLFRPKDALLASPVSARRRPSRVSCFDPPVPTARPREMSA